MLIEDLLAPTKAVDKPNGCPHPSRRGRHTSIVMARPLGHRQPGRSRATPATETVARTGTAAFAARGGARARRPGRNHPACAAAVRGPFPRPTTRAAPSTRSPSTETRTTVSTPDQRTRPDVAEPDEFSHGDQRVAQADTCGGRAEHLMLPWGVTPWMPAVGDGAAHQPAVADSWRERYPRD